MDATAGFDPERAATEAQRGIFRDGQGRILRTREWLEHRVAHLTAKREDMERRLATIDAELAVRKAELGAQFVTTQVEVPAAKRGFFTRIFGGGAE